MPDKQTTRAYYQKLYSAIPEKSALLEHFLMQTAESEAYEYKVTKQFADTQLHEAGFELVESRKIWPTDAAFGKEVGTYVEVWRGEIKTAHIPELERARERHCLGCGLASAGREKFQEF